MFSLCCHNCADQAGGTDNHLILWDLRPHGFTGSKMEKLCEAVSISLNKNAIAGDRNAIAPGWYRFISFCVHHFTSSHVLP